MKSDFWGMKSDFWGMESDFWGMESDGKDDITNFLNCHEFSLDWSGRKDAISILIIIMITGIGREVET